ncbi:Ger(x)C family spore germination protein, partial [Neobacillus drentensis]
MKKMLLFFFFFANNLLLAGCWDRTEVNDVTLITGVGIDKKNENTIELTAEVYIPKALGAGGGAGGGASGGGSPPETIIRSGKGKT